MGDCHGFQKADADADWRHDLRELGRERGAFIYRSSSYLTEFFQDCDTAYEHDGSTRKYRVADTARRSSHGGVPTATLITVDDDQSVTHVLRAHRLRVLWDIQSMSGASFLGLYQIAILTSLT